MKDNQRESQPGETIRVLLVDDEPDLTRSLMVGLRKTGWKIDTADFADVAITMVRDQPYDVVVSDERMPGMQGSDLLTLVKSECPDTLRITLSGQASLERAIHAINSAEIHRFLMKPCPPSEVRAAIEELLEKRSAQETREESRENDAARERDALVQIFESAMDRMWMSYQPIWSRDSELFACEALLRTDHPSILHPHHFFDIAETLGRSQELGARTRDLIAADLDGGAEGVKVFVNVNPDHLEDPTLYAESSPLAAYAERVVIEVTERSTITSPEDLFESLQRLSGLGFQVAVDDLGAGHSGLNTFSLLSPDVVKFDMEMIRNLDQSPTKQAVVKAMSDLCRSLGIRSVAEGIETEAEYQMAKSLGCDLFQGFLLGTPQRGFLQAPRRDVA